MEGSIPPSLLSLFLCFFFVFFAKTTPTILKNIYPHEDEGVWRVCVEGDVEGEGDGAAERRGLAHGRAGGRPEQA